MELRLPFGNSCPSHAVRGGETLTSLGQLPLDSDTASSLLPETVMLVGLIAIVLIPNLGDAKFRIPLTSVRVPVLLGGSRFDMTNDPRMPNRISNITFLVAFLSSLVLISESPREVGGVLMADGFSRIFSTMFLGRLALSQRSNHLQDSSKDKCSNSR